MKIVLANIDYRTHITDEGDQLQRGLESAGWKLCGFGYDGLTDVGQILDKYQPTHVFVQDCRDWREDSPGCFDKRVSFRNWKALDDFDGTTICVLKDAGSVKRYQQDFFNDIGYDALIHYYHKIALEDLGWKLPYLSYRTYHTMDKDRIHFRPKTKGAIISGALNAEVYPLRTYITQEAEYFGVDTMRHPGYSNNRCHTYDYLETISQYKVSVVTCSSYNFALRKIIEAVAVGAVPITNLPGFDALPGIDGALVRFNNKTKKRELKELIEYHVENYEEASRMEWAQICKKHYDYRYIGKKLDAEILSSH